MIVVHSDRTEPADENTVALLNQAWHRLRHRIVNGVVAAFAQRSAHSGVFRSHRSEERRLGRLASTRELVMHRAGRTCRGSPPT